MNVDQLKTLGTQIGCTNGVLIFVPKKIKNMVSNIKYIKFKIMVYQNFYFVLSFILIDKQFYSPGF